MIAVPAKRPPVPLSRERIIDAALHIADGQGLRRLTMRRLGDALQVEAMAIYHHLPRGKEALMDALAEHVTTVEVDPATAATWQDRARAWARASRAALLEHPGVLSLALTKPPKGSALIAITEQTEQLREAGRATLPGRSARCGRTSSAAWRWRSSSRDGPTRTPRCATRAPPRASAISSTASTR